jgi:hypothetical protein
MITCWIPNSVLRCEPSRNVAKSLAITLAEARDSLAWAKRVSILMSGDTKKIGLGLWGGMVVEGFSDSGDLGLV